MSYRSSDEEIAHLDEQLDKLEAENEQLRELVTRMSRALSVDGDWCVRECYAEFRCKGSCAIADALVELGIAEVVE